MADANAVAIDFGTSRTKLAYWSPSAGRPDLMRFDHDHPFTPSLFYLFRDEERILWGHDAEEMLERDTAGIVDVLKRKLREPAVRANRRKLSPGELLTRLFAALRERAGGEIAAFAGRTPQALSLTVPALYGPPDERVLREAAIKAGFAAEKIELVPEPVAAARAWLAETHERGQDVVVLDCGGGTIDWAYLRRAGEDFCIVAECPPSGDRHVGGHDVDLELLNLVRDALEGEADGEIEQRRFHYLRTVRALKERYCRGLPLYPLRIGGREARLEEREIQSALEERFTQQVCDNLTAYLAKVKTIEPTATPVVLLVGGSARTKGLKEAIETQCGCQTTWWERSEYATALGAVPVPERASPKREAARRDQASGARRTSPVSKPSRDTQTAHEQYRMAVEIAWADQHLDKAELERLTALAERLGLSRKEAAAVERRVMGDSNAFSKEGSPPSWADRLGRDKFGTWAEFSVVGSDGQRVTQRLRWIEPGRFLMGSPDGEPERVPNEGPRHTVILSQGFWLFDTACTQALWQAVMDDNPSEFEDAGRPVESVS